MYIYIPQWLLISLFLVSAAGLLGVILKGIGLLNKWVEDKTQEAVQKACLSLGLKSEHTSHAAPDGGKSVSMGHVHRGVVDGVCVSIGASWQIVNMIHLTDPVSGYAFPIARVTVAAELPRALAYRLRIAYVGYPAEPVLRSNDKGFDRYAKVVTDDEAAARGLLSSPALRRKIRRFVKGGPGGHSAASETAVTKNVFDAHLRGPSAVTRAVYETVALSKAISRQEQIRLGESAPTELEGVEGMLIDRLERGLRRFLDLRIVSASPVPEGRPLRDAYGNASWGADGDFLKYETPRGFPRCPLEERSPAGLVKVGVECDEGGFHDSRNTWYQYNGYMLDLLVFRETGEIWDARWERTD